MDDIPLYNSRIRSGELRGEVIIERPCKYVVGEGYI